SDVCSSDLHLLWEMMHGDVIRDGWRDDHIKKALDLCLACKGCKGDCPVNVDMATYKAEFLAHYWKGRIRPMSAYVFGWIDKWARLSSIAPGFVNLFTQLPGLRDAAGRCMTTGSLRWQSLIFDETLKRSLLILQRVRQWWFWSRVVALCFAMRFMVYSLNRRKRASWPTAHSRSLSSWRRKSQAIT